MDPVQSYLSYVSAALAAPSIVRPPLSLAVDLVGLAVALMNVHARPFAPAGARRLAWLAVLVGGLAPLLLSLGVWTVTASLMPASAWSTAALAAMLLALLLVGASTGRLTRSGVARPSAALVELAGLLIVGAGLLGVILPGLAAAGLVDMAALGTLPVPSANVAWCIALAGAVVVVAAHAAGGPGTAAPRGRRIGIVLTALAYALVVTGVTFVPDWVAGVGVWSQFDVAIHVVDALALLALASAARHLLNRPSAVDYWARSGSVPARTRRRRGQVASAPTSAPIVPAVTTSKKPIQIPALTTLPRPVVPPSALAPFSPPAVRRTVVYGTDVSATVQTAAPRVANESPAGQPPARAPLVPPDALSAPAPDHGTNRLPDDERAGSRSANRAPEVPLSPQFIEAVLLLQAEMLRAGRHYSFADLVEMFAEVPPRADMPALRALGRAGLLEAPAANQMPVPPIKD